MRRGTDDSGIESMGEYAIPYIVYHDKNDKKLKLKEEENMPT